MPPFEKALIVLSLLGVFSALSSKASYRLGVPALLFFLLIGLGAGPHGLNVLKILDFALVQNIGAVALVLILFSGGLSTKISEARRVLKPALILSTLGVLVATGLIGLFSKLAFGFSWIEGLILGATITSTDVAAVFTVLRSKAISLKEGLAPLLELESALNDPMALFLGVAFLGMATQTLNSPLKILPLFFQQVFIGALLGWGSGKLLKLIINRLKLEYEGLYPVLVLAWILLTFAAAQGIGGSGFLAVYIAGILVGKGELLHRKSLNYFFEGSAWLGQIAMFLAMGLLIHPAELWAIAPLGLGLSAFLLLVARPASVFLCFPGKRFQRNEKVLLSWAGLRGAVPIILAGYVLASSIPKGREIFNLVFFVTFISVLLQGSSIGRVAKWLKVNAPFKEKTVFPIELNATADLKNKLIEIFISKGNPLIGRSLFELKLPHDVLVVLIQRAGEMLIPRGDTEIKEGDFLLTLSEGRPAGDLPALFLK